jgi:hypothetical protein
MFVRGDISVLIPDLFRCVVAILTAPAVGLESDIWLLVLKLNFITIFFGLWHSHAQKVFLIHNFS